MLFVGCCVSVTPPSQGLTDRFREQAVADVRSRLLVWVVEFELGVGVLNFT